MKDAEKRTPIEAQMHELAEKISALSDEQKQEVNSFLNGYLTAMESIITKQPA